MMRVRTLDTTSIARAMFVLIAWLLTVPAHATQPVVNPWLAPSSYAISHHDAAQTDSTVIDGPRLGRRLQHSDVKTVPVMWCSAPTYKHIGDDTVVIASTPLGIIKVRASGEDFEEISSVPYPGRESVHADVSHEDLAAMTHLLDRHRREKNDLRLMLSSWWMYYKLNINMRTMPSGAYAVIDQDGYHYTNYDKQYLVKSFDNNQVNEPLVPVQHANIIEQLPAAAAAGIERIMGISMTYDGHLVTAATGAVLVVDRDLKVVDYVLFPGEHMENSLAVDADNGIYVVTSKRMHKLVWTGTELSQDESSGAWSTVYEVMPEGEAIALGAASHGSGTTPTLLGFGENDDRLVVISDGSPDGANLVAFWRDEIPTDYERNPDYLSHRIAGQIAIPFDSQTTIEASPTVAGNGVVVVNSTYPEPGPIPGDLISNAFLAGTTRAAPLGVQKFDWLPEENRWQTSWSLDDIDNTDWMPPGVSVSNGLVYIANKRNDTYEYLAADWETGEIVAVWPFPDDSVLWNTWGGITVFLEDGDFLLGGFFAIKRFNTGDLRP